MERNVRKTLSALAIVVMAFVMALSMNTATASAKTIKAKSITLSKKSVTLKKGKKVTLKATLKPKNTTQKKIVWSSSKKSVATVSSKGVVTAKGNGTATIKAAVKGTKLKATCKVKVITSVSKIVLKGDDTVETGKSIRLHAKVYPSKASNKKVVFTSSNTKVAIVNSKGVVKGLSEGEVTITAKALDGSGKKAKKVIKVEKSVVNPSEISLDKQECELFIGKTATLTATINPENADDKTVSWSTSDASVVTVDASGNITAVGVGTAKITAATVNDIEAECTVSVVDTISVATQGELDKSLNEIDNGTIEIKTDEKVNINTPEGSYANIKLAINAKNADITNNAKFSAIELNNVLDALFTEKAIGNSLNILSEKSSVVVEEGAVASVTIDETAKEVSLKENGEISSIKINGAALVNIEGTSNGNKNINTTVTGEGSKIITTKPLNITLDSKITLILRAGAEDTVITVENEEDIPQMQGTGNVKVHINSTNQDIIKETDELEEQYLEKMTFTGTIEDSMTAAPIASGKGYLAKYTDGIDIENIDLLEDVMTFDIADGIYSCEKVVEGSYVLMIKSDGYKDFIQMIVITSAYGEIFKNSDVRIVPVTEEDNTSSITGQILDSSNKEPVSGITVQLVKHKNNKISRAIMETITDSDGYYEFSNIESGNYTIKVVDNRTSAGKKFISTLFDVCVNKGQSLEKGTAISEAMAPDEVRFVLTWGSQGEGVIRDADAWLYGPSGIEGKVFNTSFGCKEFRVNGILKAVLDVDHTDYNGPETTTIKKKEDGIYDYYVNKYSDDGTIASSQMRVDIYIGSELVDSFVPPADCNTPMWHVCRYDSVENKVIPVNKGEKYTIYDATNDVISGNLTDIETIYMTDKNQDDLFYDSGEFIISDRAYFTLEKYLEAGNKFNIVMNNSDVITEYSIYYPGDEKFEKYAYNVENTEYDAIIYFVHNDVEHAIRVEFNGIDLEYFAPELENEAIVMNDYNIEKRYMFMASNYATLEGFINGGGYFKFGYNDGTEIQDYIISYKGEELFEKVSSDEYDAVISPKDGKNDYYYVKYESTMKEVPLDMVSAISHETFSTEFYKGEGDNEIYYMYGYIELKGTQATLDENIEEGKYSYTSYMFSEEGKFDCVYISKNSDEYATAMESSGVKDADGFVRVTSGKYGVTYYVAFYYTCTA